MEKQSNNHILLYLIRLFGVFAIYIGVKELFTISSGTIILNLAITAIFYLLFSPWAVTLPSGANWRPGMAFILFSILNFDYRLVILVAIPGTLYNVWEKKGFLSSFLQTIGHLSIGIFAAGFVNELMDIKFTVSVMSYISITICLLVHFCFNRLVAALIVAIKKERSFIKQIFMIKHDLNWGYHCAYVLSILMYLIFRVYSVPGMLLVIFLLAIIYQAFTYFQKLKDIEEKIYLDGLTEAENRMSWEEFLQNYHKHNEPGILFMMDLDQFKMINDTYGHDFGDRILQEFVGHIKKEIKSKYRLFRYGGDEFILFINSSQGEQSELLNEVINTILCQNEIWSKKELDVAVSFGYALLSEHENIEDIVRKADKLMYQNKFERNMEASVDKKEHEEEFLSV